MPSNFYESKFDSIKLPLQYDFTILITNPNENVSDIKFDLSQRLRKYYGIFNEYESKKIDLGPESLNNILYTFIVNVTKRHFSFAGNTRAFVADYTERRGSLILTFTLIIITNYGGIRETIDYFTNDLERAFDLIARDGDYNVEVLKEENTDGMRSNSGVPRRPQQNISSLTSIQPKKLLWGFISFLILVLFAWIIYYFENQGKAYDRGELDVIIERKVDQIIRDKRIDQFLDQQIPSIKLADTTNRQ